MTASATTLKMRGPLTTDGLLAQFWKAISVPTSWLEALVTAISKKQI